MPFLTLGAVHLAGWVGSIQLAVLLTGAGRTELKALVLGLHQTAGRAELNRAALLMQNTGLFSLFLILTEEASPEHHWPSVSREQLV